MTMAHWMLTQLLFCCLSESTCELLKEHLIDELDYMLLPEEAWQKLVGWYDIMEGQVAIYLMIILC